MDKIKRFFEQKKTKAKFALMPEGTKLSSSSAPSSSALPPVHYGNQGRAEQTHDARRAGEAALARMESKNNPRIPAPSSTYMKLKSQIEAEMKAEAKAQNTRISSASTERKEILKDGPRMLEVRGIYFTCPLVGPEVAAYNTIKERISAFLEEQLLTQEPAMAAALMIHSLNNKDPEKVKKCIEILTKYLENVISNPSEEKFCHIRLQNKALQERVLPIRGSIEFLQAVGFETSIDCTGDNAPEDFLVLPQTKRDPTQLKEKLDVLLLAEPILPVLDRGVKVFFPSPNAGRFMELPDDFFAISKEELRKEMQAKQEEVEKLGMLRTKAMKERDAQRELRRYRCSLLRFRFPDQTIIQATFWSTETAKDLIVFLKEHVEPDWAPFSLFCRSAQGLQLQLTDEIPGTIAEHGLCPSSLITVEFDSDLMDQCKNEHIPPPRLKSSTLECIQPISS